MKKISLIVFLLILSACLCCCSIAEQTEQQSAAENKQTSIITTELTSESDDVMVSPTTETPDGLPLLGIENKSEILYGIDEIYYDFIEEYIVGVAIYDENKGVVNVCIELEGVSEDELLETVENNIGDLVDFENNTPNGICDFDIIQDDDYVKMVYSFIEEKMDGFKTPKDYYELLKDEMPSMPEGSVIDTIALGYTESFTDLRFCVMCWDFMEGAAEEYMDSLGEYDKTKYDEYKFAATAKNPSGLDIFVEYKGSMIETNLIWEEPGGTSVDDEFKKNNPYTMCDEDIIKDFINDPISMMTFTETAQKIYDILGYNGGGISLSASEKNDMVNIIEKGDNFDTNDFDIEVVDIYNCVEITMLSMDIGMIDYNKSELMEAFSESYIFDYIQDNEFECIKNDEYMVKFEQRDLALKSFEADSSTYNEAEEFISSLQFDELMHTIDSFERIDMSIKKSAGIVPTDDGQLMLALDIEFLIELDEKGEAMEYYIDYFNNRFDETNLMDIEREQLYGETTDILLIQSYKDAIDYQAMIAEYNGYTLIVLSINSILEQGEENENN